MTLWGVQAAEKLDTRKGGYSTAAAETAAAAVRAVAKNFMLTVGIVAGGLIELTVWGWD